MNVDDYYLMTVNDYDLNYTITGDHENLFLQGTACSLYLIVSWRSRWHVKGRAELVKKVKIIQDNSL